MKLNENPEGGSADMQWGGPEAEPWDTPPWKVREKSKKQQEGLRRSHP